MRICWRVLVESKIRSPALNLGLEEAIAEHVGSGSSPPTLYFWRNARTLVLGRFESRLPGFREAVNQARQAGWKVVSRKSGGTAILQDRCCLNFSIVVPRSLLCAAQQSVEGGYEILGSGLLKGLALLGVEAKFGRVEGAFCSGSHDVMVQGRKIGGTAQWRRRHFILVHGTLFVACKPERVLPLLSRFYETANGDQSSFDPESLTTLERQVKKSRSFRKLCQTLALGYCQPGSLRRGFLKRSELEQARHLAAAYRIRDSHPDDPAGP